MLPPHSFPRLLDLCCGPGRHASLLAHRGYQILGLDANESAVRRAQALCPDACFEVGDMRSLSSLPGPFDGVVNLWHSFGYYDDETNQAVVHQVREILRRSGRAIFDLYNRDHFATRPLIEVTERGGRRIRTTRSWRGLRQRVVLEYDGRIGEELEWRLYSPGEFHDLCAAAGLRTLVQCAWFDEATPVSPEHARMQFVVERVV